jgi:DNA-binding beta-propeller fold protein YncE
VVPELRALEEKYRDAPFVVVGVHSAKFDNEHIVENIRNAVMRYGIDHPVVVDREMVVWQSYGVRAWPTMVLIDPEGYVLGGVSGEGYGPTLERLIGQVLQEHEQKGTLDPRPVGIRPERLIEAPRMLLYPGKVLADPANDRLFVADTGHHRIIMSRWDGSGAETIGAGRHGWADGDFASAQFDHPHGMALEGDTLYLADTENHLIRAIDLAARQVTTVAGTGQQGRGPTEPGPAKTTHLNSPWDLCFIGERLFIAMAGNHQIGELDRAKDRIEVYAGTGREALGDGPVKLATFAQPSGLTTDGETLYLADSEVSCIRAIDVHGREWVRTLVGGDLFDFGDVDGTAGAVRLQHPLGVAYGNDVMYVADTYNHKLKIVDPAERRCQTFLGDGRAGLVDGSNPRFYEPGGLSFAGDRLYVADTNNHAVRVVDLRSREVSTLSFPGVTPPESSDRQEC